MENRPGTWNRNQNYSLVTTAINKITGKTQLFPSPFFLFSAELQISTSLVIDESSAFKETLRKNTDDMNIPYNVCERKWAHKVSCNIHLVIFWFKLKPQYRFKLHTTTKKKDWLLSELLCIYGATDFLHLNPSFHFLFLTQKQLN